MILKMFNFRIVLTVLICFLICDVSIARDVNYDSLFLQAKKFYYKKEDTKALKIYKNIYNNAENKDFKALAAYRLSHMYYKFLLEDDSTQKYITYPLDNFSEILNVSLNASVIAYDFYTSKGLIDSVNIYLDKIDKFNIDKKG